MRNFGRFTLMLLLLLSLPVWLQAQGGANYEWHRERGEALYRSGNYIEAFREYGLAKETGEGLGEMELSEIDYYMAMSAQRGGRPDAAAWLESYFELYPTSVYAPAARYALGNLRFDSGDFGKAQEVYAGIDTAKLGNEERNAYNFKYGYCYFAQGEYDRAYPYMEEVDYRSDYYPHAQYVKGYADYRAGRYDKAREHFADIAETEAYAHVIPYFLLQIEYGQGNYHYVTENGPRIAASSTGERARELNRIIAESYFHNKQWDEALLFMDRFSSEGGVSGRIENYIVGFSYYMLGDYANAERRLSLVPGQDDLLSQNASYHLGDVYIRLGDKHKALQSFSIASTEGYDDAISEDALFNYGKLQYEQGGGYFNEAINVLSRYLTLYPRSPRVNQVKEYLVAAYYNSKNFEAAYQAIMQMPDPDNNVRAALQRITYFRALEYFNTGDYSNAWNLLEESLRNRYNAKYTALAGYWQGEILFRTGNYEGAAQKYETYVRLSPKAERENAIARYNLGYCYFNVKDWEKSKEWFENFLVEYKPNDNFKADANNRRGDIEYTGRSFWRAIDYYDRAATAGTPEKYYSAFQRAMTVGMLDRPDSKAEALSRIAGTAESPYAAEAAYQLGHTYIVQQKFRQAADAMEGFVAAHPDSHHYIYALADLGLIYQNLGDDTKALDHYKRVVEAEKHSALGRDAMNGIRSIYVDRNDVNGYFAYARSVGIETDFGAVQRDSLSFAAAQRAYQAGDRTRAELALVKYMADYPLGAYRHNALYYLGETALAEGEKGKAFGYFGELAGMSSNPYTVPGLERTASLGLELKEYGAAAEAYDKLSRSAESAAKRDEALAGYMGALIYAGDFARIADTADDVVARAGDRNLIRETKYTKAVALERLGRSGESLEIFRTLSSDVSNAEGAEAAYRVIKAEYLAGNKEQAEKLVYAFAEKNTPYAQWLGRAFLTLGDIYTEQGNTFQARATFQSIVDGYPDREDGIIEEAAGKIRELK